MERLEEIFGLPIDALWRFFAAVLRKIYSTLTTVKETTVGHQVVKFSGRPKTDSHCVEPAPSVNPCCRVTLLEDKDVSRLY